MNQVGRRRSVDHWERDVIYRTDKKLYEKLPQLRPSSRTGIDQSMTNSLIIDEKTKKKFLKTNLLPLTRGNNLKTDYYIKNIQMKGVVNGFRCYFKCITRDKLLAKGIPGRYLLKETNNYFQLIFTNQRVVVNTTFSSIHTNNISSTHGNEDENIGQELMTPKDSNDSLKIDDIILRMNNCSLSNLTSPEYLTRYLANVKKDQVICFQVLRKDTTKSGGESCRSFSGVTSHPMNHTDCYSYKKNVHQSRKATMTIKVRKISRNSLGFNMRKIGQDWTVSYISQKDIIIECENEINVGDQIVLINDVFTSKFPTDQSMDDFILNLPIDTWIQVEFTRSDLTQRECEKSWCSFINMPFLRSSSLSKKNCFKNGGDNKNSNLHGLGASGPCNTPDFLPASNFLKENFGEEINQEMIVEVTIPKGKNGYGFRIIGGAEEGTQVMIGAVNVDGTAFHSGRLYPGDILLAIDGISVVGATHDTVVQLIESVSSRSQYPKLNLMVRGFRKRQSDINNFEDSKRTNNFSESSDALSTDSYNSQCFQSNPVHQYQQVKGSLQEIVLTRRKEEGFGFVIVSSLGQNRICEIGRIIPNSPADRCCRLTVGDKILKINGECLSDKNHIEIVELIKSAEQILVLLIEKCPVNPFQEGNFDSIHLNSFINNLPPDQSNIFNDSAFTSSVYTQPIIQENKISKDRYEEDEENNNYQYITEELIPPVVSSATKHVNQIKNSPTFNKMVGDELPTFNNNNHSNSSKDNYELGNEKKIEVIISRGKKGFGFSIKEIIEKEKRKIHISKINDTSLSNLCEIGDEILCINRIPIDNESFENIIKRIQGSQDKVELTIKRQICLEKEEDL